jgi:hypothetical protein
MPFKARDCHVIALGSDWRKVLLASQLRYTHPETGKVYTVPKGFKSDYGSIPRVLWWWLPPHQYRPEYLLHDMLYACELVQREEADNILKMALKEAGANWFRRNIIYAGVRAGGWVVWKNHTSESISECRKLRGGK